MVKDMALPFPGEAGNRELRDSFLDLSDYTNLSNLESPVITVALLGIGPKAEAPNPDAGSAESTSTVSRQAHTVLKTFS